MVESPNGSALQASESLPYLSPSGGGGRGLVSSRAHTDLYHSTLSLLLREPLWGGVEELVLFPQCGHTSSMVGTELASLPRPPWRAAARALLGSLPPLLATAEVP